MKKRNLIFFVILFALCLTGCGTPNNTGGTNNPPVGGTPNYEVPSIETDKDHYVVGDEIIFNVTNYDDLSLFDITFSDQYCVSLNNEGKYIVKKVGEFEATFTLYDDPNYTSTISFAVYAPQVPLDYTTNAMAVGDKIEVWVYNFDNLFEQNNEDFTFTVSDDKLASIDGRIVTALGKGTFDVIVTSKYHERVTAKVTITVGDNEDLFMIKPPFELNTLKAGDQFYMEISQNYSASEFNWSTNNSEVIRVVDMDGKCQITIVGKGQGAVICYNIKTPTIRTKYTVNITETAEIDYVGRFLDLAYAQVGIKEIGENGQKFGEWYGNPNQPWCAQFVSWNWYHAGLSNDLLVKYQSCYQGMKWCSEQGIMHYVQNYTFPANENMLNGIYSYKREDYIPKSGDIVFFLSNGAGHTGIVGYCDGTYIYTIEGNRSNCAGVWRIKLTNTTITGYASPKYPACSNPKDFSWLKEKQANGSYLWTDVTSGDSWT